MTRRVIGLAFISILMSTASILLRGGFETMMVLIVEVFEEEESAGLCDERKE